MESLRPPPPPAPEASDARDGSEPGEARLSEPAPRGSVDALSDDSSAMERGEAASFAPYPGGEVSFTGSEDEEKDDSTEAVPPILPPLNADSSREDSGDGGGDSDSLGAAPEALGAGAVVAEELAAETSMPDFHVPSDDGLAAREDGGAEDAAIIGSLVPPPRRVGAVPLLLLALLIAFFAGRWVLQHRARAANDAPLAPKEVVAEVPVPASPEAPPVEVVAEEDSPPPGTSASGPHRRGTPPDVPPDPSPQYGPSVARFPDLPRSVLIELERASTPADPSANTD